MGISIRNNNFSYDMGCGGFLRFRRKVAEQFSEEFGKHYSDVEGGMFLYGKAKECFFERYDAKTLNMVKSGKVSDKLAHFCYQLDTEGSIDQAQAKEIYDLIKDLDGSEKYGYIAHPNCTTMFHLQLLFEDCAKNGGIIEWS